MRCFSDLSCVVEHAVPTKFVIGRSVTAAWTIAQNLNFASEQRTDLPPCGLRSPVSSERKPR